MMVVCDPSKVYEDGIHGAPDLVVEVLSPATIRIDRIQKTQLYGQCGVREYWIVDTGNKSVEVYLNESGCLHLQNVYVLYPDDVVAKMSEEKCRREVVNPFKASFSRNSRCHCGIFSKGFHKSEVPPGVPKRKKLQFPLYYGRDSIQVA